MNLLSGEPLVQGSNPSGITAEPKGLDREWSCRQRISAPVAARVLDSRAEARVTKPRLMPAKASHSRDLVAPFLETTTRIVAEAYNGEADTNPGPCRL